MDIAFDAQFRIIRDAFARDGVPLEVAYKASGGPDFVYAADHILTVDDGAAVDTLTRRVPGLAAVERPVRRLPRGVVAMRPGEVRGRRLSVPETLDLLDEEAGIGDRARATPGPVALDDRVPRFGPDHLVHIARLCAPTEPEVPGGAGTPAPWPPPVAAPGGDGPVHPVSLGICDTGLLEDVYRGREDRYPWMARVTGETDDLVPQGEDLPPLIPAFCGHGTFAAGVAACMAPTADIHVTDHLETSGGELESAMLAKLEELATSEPRPQVLNLSAGTYTRNNWASIGFAEFRRRHPDVVLVAAAGNDSTSRPFYPAAFEGVVAVGALGADGENRAWFSNFGDWVDVYVLGEGLVNAFATGEYHYQEPPKRPAVQVFGGMARWAGTSFSAPLVAGLIAARIARTGESAREAADALLELAAAQRIPGVGPALGLGDTGEAREHRS